MMAVGAAETARLPWRVLLIGGGSGVGKTVAARELGRRLGVSVLLADDLRMAAQALTTRASHPNLHVLSSDQSVHEMGPERAVESFIAVAGALTPAVLTAMAHHLVVEGPGPVIIEGDGLLPALAEQRYDTLRLFRGVAPSPAVRMVVVHEPEEARLFANFRERGRGFEDLTEGEQTSLVNACWRYGEWLRDEARARAVPVVHARPHKTLVTRILSAAEGPEARA